MRLFFSFLAVLCLTSCSSVPVSPLAGAARAGDQDAIKILVKAGAELEERSGVNGWTPLMHAVHKDQRGSVRTLLALGANPNAVSPSGETALMMAAGYGQNEIINELLLGGADAAQKTASGSTALDAALTGANDIDRFTVGTCQTETVRLLMEKAPTLKPAGGNAEQLFRKLRNCPAVH
jgi:hypothetical protein